MGGGIGFFMRGIFGNGGGFLGVILICRKEVIKVWKCFNMIKY